MEKGIRKLSAKKPESKLFQMQKENLQTAEEKTVFDEDDFLGEKPIDPSFDVTVFFCVRFFISQR